MKGNSKNTSTKAQNRTNFLKYITSLDRYVSLNLENCGIETRPVKSNGLWCGTLVPAILLTYTWLHKVSPLYNVVAYVSVCLLLNSLLFTVFMSISPVVLKDQFFGGCIASGLSATLFLYICLGYGIIFSLALTVPTVYLYTILLRTTIVSFPKTFTVGEAMLIVQSIVLLLVSVVASVCGIENDASGDPEKHLVNVIIYAGLSSVGLIVTLLYNLKDADKTVKNLVYIITGGAIFMFVILHIALGRLCMFQIINYVFFVGNRAQIFLFWLFLSFIAIIVLLFRTKIAVKATTVTRKSFHVLASLVFMTGILYDTDLMRLAAAFGFGVLILVEAMRKSGIEPVSSALQAAFDVYSDEKDCGCFAITPMYLFVGLACPLVLVPSHRGATLELLSGVLATGVGDTAASWFGSRWGVNKWPDGNRTMEGTVFNVLSQVLVVYALDLFELLHTRLSLLRIVIAATISALIEAKTEQVDNIILPLTTLLGFQATWFLC